MQPPLLVVDVQSVLVSWAGDHAKDPQRWGNLKRLPWRQHLGVTHQRQAQTQIILPSRVVEELPGQPGQLRWVDPQHHPQGRAFLAGTLGAGDVKGVDVIGDEGVEQPPAELLHR